MDREKGQADSERLRGPMVAGDREVFEKAMRAATGVAWEGDWLEAISAYERALEEFPESVPALSGLGMAYRSVGRPGKALEIYRRASEIEPEDPVLLQQLAKALEEVGHKKEAARAFLACGRQYIEQQRAPQLAAGCWEAAADLDPSCVDVRVALLKQYQREGRTGKAVGECLALAGLYRDRQRPDYAIRLCEHAQRLAPDNPDVSSMLDELRQDGEMRAGADAGTRSASEAAVEPELAEVVGLDFEAAEAYEQREEKGSPAEVTRRKALSELAESIFREQEPFGMGAGGRGRRTVDALISEAIDLQARGKAAEAVTAYEKVIEAGGDCAAVQFSLGYLYQELRRFDDAVAEFKRAAAHSDYRLGSYFALGECYRARGRVNEALEHFIEVLKTIDVANAREEHTDDLLSLYEHLSDGYLVEGHRSQALDFVNSLVSLLKDEDWEDRVRAARQILDTLAGQGTGVSLAEALTVPHWERTLESIATSREYVRRGLYYSAMEECHYALESTPTCLPVHRQLADVCLAMGDVEEAVNKFVVIGDTYRTRGLPRQAVAMYERALDLAPMDAGVRAKVIDLLVSDGNIDDALREYLMLADSHYRLAQMGLAREAYEEALRLAHRSDEARDWTVRILHRIADIDTQRVDWRRAVSVYERIRDEAPGDERARRSLTELYHRLNRPERAIQELDGLLQLYRERGRAERMFSVLSDLVERWPDSIPLRGRVAEVHLDVGDTEVAVEHMERLAHLQLDAGQREEAKATIRAIIALNPPGVDGYQDLLETMGTTGQAGA